MQEILCLIWQHSKQWRMRLEKRLPSNQCGTGCADLETLPMGTHKFAFLSQFHLYFPVPLYSDLRILLHYIVKPPLLGHRLLHDPLSPPKESSFPRGSPRKAPFFYLLEMLSLLSSTSFCIRFPFSYATDIFFLLYGAPVFVGHKGVFSRKVSEQHQGPSTYNIYVSLFLSLNNL